MSPLEAIPALAHALSAALPDPTARVAVVPVQAGEDGLLSIAERQRAGGFRFPKRKEEWTAGRAAAKLALLDALAEHRGPEDFTVTTGSSGEPVVSTASGSSVSFGVSITHAGGLAAAVAFPLDRPLGLDLEPIGTIDPGLATLACTPREQSLLERWPAGARRTEALLRIWTVKEAAVKLTRTGLGVPLHQVQVEPLSSGSSEFAVRLPSAPDGKETGCRVRVIVAGEWIAALAWFPG